MQINRTLVRIGNYKIDKKSREINRIKHCDDLHNWTTRLGNFEQNLDLFSEQPHRFISPFGDRGNL